MQIYRKAAACIFALFVLGVLGQEATERFIPIGQSPGLSGSRTIIGTVEQVNPQTGEMTVAYQKKGGRFSTQTAFQTARMTARTAIFLDRSSKRKTNTCGTIDDIRAGQTVEILFWDQQPDVKFELRWIKVQQ